MLEITPVNQDFVAEIAGIDLRAPLTPDVANGLKAALDEYAVLVIPDQALNEAQQLKVAEVFGPLETSVGASIYNAKRPRRLDHAQLSDISNLDESGKLLEAGDIRRLINLSNQLWHTDSSFKPVPAMASLLSGREVPPAGGETEFVSARHAYATLPDETRRRLEGRVVVHSILYSRSTIAKALFDPEQERALPPVRQALVRANPMNGRKSIYIGSHAWYIEGLPYEESRRLLDDLLAHTTREGAAYQHRWKQWDLVMWDNRCVLHRGRPWDASRHARIMRRTTVAGDGPTADPPFASRTPMWEGIVPQGVGV